ncbi:MAG: hypothetical protein JO033_00865 [Acidobacteriaceae bacterium]|nr:hypothetical protein [Acidobacteriaceae bacterium]MBV9501302.1 hypothetical protein [Acidobacteriaceae bacterium]
MILVVVGSLWACALAFIAQQAATTAPSHIIRIDARLVLLHATVTDGNGNAVSGLGLSAFRLFVDDQPHPIRL